MKNHPVGENIKMPACKIIVGKVLGQDSVQKMKMFHIQTV
jgi:hypothetical protein